MAGRRRRRKPVRPVLIEGDIAYVPLTDGYTAIIDADQAARVGRMNWRASKGKGNWVYAYAYYRGRHYALHRLIMYARKGKVIDHINGDGLDNRKANLRSVTSAENWQNCYYHRDPALTGKLKSVRLTEEIVRNVDAAVGIDRRGSFIIAAVERALAELADEQAA